MAEIRSELPHLNSYLDGTESATVGLFKIPKTVSPNAKQGFSRKGLGVGENQWFERNTDAISFKNPNWDLQAMQQSLASWRDTIACHAATLHCRILALCCNELKSHPQELNQCDCESFKTRPEWAYLSDLDVHQVNSVAPLFHISFSNAIHFGSQPPDLFNEDLACDHNYQVCKSRAGGPGKFAMFLATPLSNAGYTKHFDKEVHQAAFSVGLKILEERGEILFYKMIAEQEEWVNFSGQIYGGRPFLPDRLVEEIAKQNGDVVKEFVA
ncbi:hypothetical protein HDU98_007770 [Podochytrium sp. JEL0797]|nr:hypothetical protein HDU98_007770 [Podochytrium sp. JEL0797]